MCFPPKKSHSRVMILLQQSAHAQITFRDPQADYAGGFSTVLTPVRNAAISLCTIEEQCKKRLGTTRQLGGNRAGMSFSAFIIHEGQSHGSEQREKRQKEVDSEKQSR